MIFKRGKIVPRVIAYLTACIMLLSPLFSYVGEDKGGKAKAEESVAEFQIGFDADGDRTYYYWGTRNVMVTNNNESVYYYKLVYSDDTESDAWTEIGEDGFFVDTDSVKKILFADSEAATEAAYTYTLTSADYTGSEYAWFSSDKKVTFLTAVSSAEIRGAAFEYTAEDAYHIGKIKYAYATYKSGKKNASDYNLAWSDDAVILNSSSGLNNGSYIGFIGYFSDNDVCLDTKCVDVVNLDVTGPDIESVYLEQFNGQKWNKVDSNMLDENKIRYTLDGEKYRYSISISDTSGIDKDNVMLVSKADDTIKKVFTKDDSTDNTYVCEISETDIPAYGTAGTDWKLSVKDTLGNLKEKTDLPQLKQADTEVVLNEAYLKRNNDKLQLPAEGETLYINKVYNLNGRFSAPLLENLDMRIMIDGNDVCTDDWNDKLDYVKRRTERYNGYIPVSEDNNNVQTIKIIGFELYNNDTLLFSKKYGSIVYDPIAPVVDSFTLQRSSITGIDTETVWQDVNKNEVENGVYYVDKDLEDVRYKIKVTDKGSGIEKGGIVCKDANGNTYNVIEDTENDNIYYIEIPKERIVMDKPLGLRVKVTDKAGNEKSNIDITPYIQERDKKLIVFAQLKDADGNVKELVEGEPLKDYINAGCTLQVKASSGNQISAVTFNFNEVVENAHVDSKYISQLKRHVAEVSFDIPPNVDANVYLQNMKVYVEDAMGESVTMTLGELFYDRTNPVVLNNEENTELSIENKWVKPYELLFRIQSGNESMSFESALEYAEYTISDAKNSSDNVTSRSLGADGITTDIKCSFNVPESVSINGTCIEIAARDKSQNYCAKKLYAYVDGTKPELSGFSVDAKLDSEPEFRIPFGGFPTIDATVSDNLTLSEIKFEITYPGDAGVKKVSKTFAANEAVEDNIEKSLSYKLKPLSGDSIPDGQYKVKITAIDKAGNEMDAITKRFTVDNTPPVVNVKIASGTMGGKNPRKNFDDTIYDYYYSSNVDVELMCDDKNARSIIVTDNGNQVYPEWSEDLTSATYTVTTDGRHTIKINAVDKTGNVAIEKQIEFIKDTGKPTLSLLVNGDNYNDSMGVVDFIENTTVSVSVSDTCEDINDLNYQVIKNVPDKTVMTSEYLKTANRTFSFSEEAEYKVNFYAVDMAGNQSQTKSVNFRIDKTAPNLSIGGALGGTTADAATVTFTMRELFWRDATGTVNIYRKASDGSEETLLKTIDFKPTAFETSISETFSDTGVYRMEFEAADKAGHTATASQTLTIDRDAPEIILSGVSNYDVTDQTVEFSAEIRDDFYLNKTVTITGTRTDSDGKVNAISFSDYNVKGNPTIISEIFDKDGIYDIEVTAVDIAGNSNLCKVHFTVDKTVPVIVDLSEYDGTVIKEFSWTKDLDSLVSDLTVCNIHMYLNGSEYDGVSEIEDGSYTLLITAEDELGHYVEKTVSFILDTKAPVFIVTGVEDGEVRNDMYTIGISLQLEEDILQSVTLNGKDIIITDNTAAITVEEKGKYTLKMTAIDEAGNAIEETIEFQYGQASHWWIWLIIAIAILLILVIIIVIKNVRKNNLRN